MEEKCVRGNMFRVWISTVQWHEVIPLGQLLPRPNGQALEPKGSDLLNYFYMEKIKAKCYVGKDCNGSHQNN